MAIKITLLAAFFISMIAIGIYCSKKASTASDFVLGGRSVGAWFTAFAYGTSYFSAVIFVGYAGQFGWTFGISAFWIGIGNVILGSLLAWLILAKRTRIMTNALEVSTMPSFFAKRYDSVSLKYIAAFIVFIFLIPYSASVYKGLSDLISLAFGIGSEYFPLCILIMALITAFYVVLGGYMATALSSFIQGILMLVGIVCVLVSVLSGNGGLVTALSELSKIEDAAGNSGVFTSVFGPQPLDLFAVVILTSVGTWGLPQMVHKFYTIKDDNAVKRGTIISTVFALVVAGGSYFLGGFARLLKTDVPLASDGSVAFDQIIPTMLNVMIAPEVLDIMLGLVLVLVFSASMSTLSSIVISSSSTFVLDFLVPVFPVLKDQKKQVVWMRMLCFVFILLSALIAIIAFYDASFITTLMGISWGALSGAFTGPFFYGLFWKKATKTSVFSCFAISLLIIVSNMFIGFTTPTIAAAIAILSSFVTVPLVSLFTKKVSKEHLENVFNCFNK